jgi:hypothetical protein
MGGLLVAGQFLLITGLCRAGGPSAGDPAPSALGLGDGWLQVGPGRASVTQGGRLNGLQSLLQGVSGVCNPPSGQLDKPFVLLDELCPRNGRQPSNMDELL